MRGRGSRSGVTTYVILTLAAMVAAAPIAGVLLVALGPPNALVAGLALPSHLSLTNIEQVWNQGDFSGALAWSAITTGGTVALATPLAVPAGYAFARIRFPARQPLFYLFLFGVLLPYSSVLIPTYYELRTVSLTGTPWAVILPSAALSIAFGILWMRAAFLGVPKELLEAARVDGASSLRTFSRVALPLVRSAVLVFVLLTFLWTWNSFLIPLVLLAGSNISTATMTMAGFQGAHVTDIPGLAAAALFVSMPVIVVYALTQRHFIRGFTEGSLKM